ncbi:MAG: hypothetical protein IT308_03810 [Anaerolineaceae bacterium]|nr:hypothetical protein [Anaerolineaceae bacterium]
MMGTPSGEEREVKFLGGASIDGAPVAYIVVLAAVVTALSFIPFSIVMATGGSFPMAQGVYQLVGWVLGPIAGAVASGIGALLGVFIAPQTAGVAPVTVYGAALAAFAAGTMVHGSVRSKWWIIPGVIGVGSILFFFGRALLVNGVSLKAVILGGGGQWFGVLLFVLPTRTIFSRWIASKNIGTVAAGLFLGTWASHAIAHVAQSSITYYMYNWPEEVWMLLAGIVPVEYVARCLIGAVIGTGVIAGLRAIGLVKPTYAIY